MTPTQVVWSVCLLLFLSGLACLVLRRQLLAMILGLELMINSANVGLVYVASRRGDPEGLAVALLVIALAAAEAVVGLSLMLSLRLQDGSSDTEQLRELAG